MFSRILTLKTNIYFLSLPVRRSERQRLGHFFCHHFSWLEKALQIALKSSRNSRCYKKNTLNFCYQIKSTHFPQSLGGCKGTMSHFLRPRDKILSCYSYSLDCTVHFSTEWFVNSKRKRGRNSITMKDIVRSQKMLQQNMKSETTAKVFAFPQVGKIDKNSSTWLLLQQVLITLTLSSTDGARDFMSLA